MNPYFYSDTISNYLTASTNEISGSITCNSDFWNNLKNTSFSMLIKGTASATPATSAYSAAVEKTKPFVCWKPVRVGITFP